MQKNCIFQALVECMRLTTIFLLFFILTSCDDLKKKKISSEAILNEELQSFNWKDVDEYPSFKVCDSNISKTEKQNCFQNTLAKHITRSLQDEMIVVTQDIHDTILLDFKVSKLGDLELLSSDVDSLTIKEIPNIQLLLKNSIIELPKMYPAIKRGQQVATTFAFPLVIQVD